MSQKVVAAVILTFHPDWEVLGNIRSILPQVDRLFIVNNAVTGEVLELLKEFQGNSKIEFLNNENNLGVAEGFNCGMRASYDQGFSYTVLFDQDSRPGENMIKQLIDACTINGSLTLVGPSVRDRKTHHVGLSERGEGIQSVPVLISSGMLIPRLVIEKFGYHDAGLFIDHVDHDYCLRVRHAGGKIIKVYNAFMEHTYGESHRRTIVGVSFFLYNYSPLRHYHMARNKVILLKRYGPKGWFWSDVRFFLKGIAKIILFEGQKSVKIRAILRGLKEGLLDRK